MKALKALVVVLIIGALAGAAALWYVKPAEALDLSYAPLRLDDKLAAMLLERKFEISLSEGEVDSLIKTSLAAKPRIHPDATVTGARFTLQDGTLAADVNLLVKERWPAGVKLRFELAWQEPVLTIRHVGTDIRQVPLPPDWFRLDPFDIRLEDYMPRPVGIRSVSFAGSEMKLQLKLR